MYEIYEVTSDEVSVDASPVFTRIHPEDYDYIVETIQKSAQNQTIYQSEFRVILPEQGLRWLHCDAKPQLMEDGSTLWHGIIIDITEQKRADEKIKEQQLLFETMFHTITDAVVITDKHRNIVLANNGITSTFGYLPEEVIGQSSEILYSSDEKFRQAGEEVFNEPSFRSDKLYMTTYRGKLNNVFPGETFGAKLYDSKGEWIGNLGVIKNVSERIRYIDDLKVARERAEESDRLKTAFLHNISHEIRTPMNAIIGFSELLIKSNAPPDKNGYYCDVISQSCNQLLSIIDDILNLATIEACKVKIHESNIELNTMLKFIYNQFILKAAKQNLFLDLSVDMAESIYIRTDKTKLIEILTNLIGNALKFTLQGSITFGYTIRTQYIEFFVRDTGIGIPPEMHEEVFERFRQLETSDARQFGGTGLGLSISKAYVELLGGKIWFDSVPGKGTEFVFTIPFHSSGNIWEDPVAEISETQMNEPKILLIAEDEDSNYFLLEEFLIKTNYHILRALNGLQAVNICRENVNIDLVLMDIKMPVKDGCQAAREIKEFRPTLPIIAQTAFSSDSDHEKALNSGCDDTITKPINREILLSKIKKHIDWKIPEGNF
jgi:PAS domain S-box-containing protein